MASFARSAPGSAITNSPEREMFAQLWLRIPSPIAKVGGSVLARMVHPTVMMFALPASSTDVTSTTRSGRGQQLPTSLEGISFTTASSY
jgi:hypothetical protein